MNSIQKKLVSSIYKLWEADSKRVATLELIDGSKRCRALKGDYVLKTVWGEIYTLDEESFLTSFEEI